MKFPLVDLAAQHHEIVDEIAPQLQDSSARADDDPGRMHADV